MWTHSRWKAALKQFKALRGGAESKLNELSAKKVSYQENVRKKELEKEAIEEALKALRDEECEYEKRVMLEIMRDIRDAEDLLLEDHFRDRCAV